MESQFALDLSDCSKILDTLQFANPSKLGEFIISKVKPFSSPSEPSTGVIFNTIDLLAKKLDDLKSGKSFSSAKKPSKKKKKIFLQTPLPSSKASRENISKAAIEIHSAKLPRNPQSLLILSKTAAAALRPKFSLENFENALYKTIEENPRPSLQYLCLLHALGPERYTPSANRGALHALKICRRAEAQALGFFALLPQATKFLYEVVFNEISASMSGALVCLDLLRNYASTRPRERGKALKIILHFAHFGKSQVKSAALQMLCRRLFPRPDCAAAIEEDAAEHFSRAFAVSRASLEPEELKADFLSRRLEEAEKSILDKYSADDSLRSISKSELEEIKASYVESVKKATLLQKQKTQKAFEGELPAKARAKISAECSLFLALCGVKRSLLLKMCTEFGRREAEFKPLLMAEIEGFLATLLRLDWEFFDALQDKVLTSLSFGGNEPLIGAMVRLMVARLVECLQQGGKAPCAEATDSAEPQGEKDNRLNPIKKAKFDLKSALQRVTTLSSRCIQMHKKLKTRKKSKERALRKVILPVFFLLDGKSQKSLFCDLFKVCDLDELKSLLDFSVGKKEFEGSEEVCDKSSVYSVVFAEFREDKDKAKTSDISAGKSEVKESDLEIFNYKETALWIFAKLHKIVRRIDHPDILKALELTNHCLKKEDLFTPDLLRQAVSKIMRAEETSVLLLRTLIQIFLLHPETIDLVLAVQLQLVKRRVWQSPSLWEGFLKCVAWTLPSSVGVIAKLDPKVAFKAFEEDEALRDRLREVCKADQSLAEKLPSALKKRLVGRSGLGKRSLARNLVPPKDKKKRKR